MLRRLFDGPDQGLDDNLRLLDGLRPLIRADGRCSLVAALQLALGHLRQPLAYQEIMALTGAAFALELTAAFLPPLTPALPLLEALADLGHRATLLTAPSPAVVFECVGAEITAGRPALALGWGTSPRAWCLLTGTQGDDLLGYASEGRRLERHAARLDLLLLFGDPQPPVAGEIRLRRALHRARPLLDRAQEQYRQWADLLAVECPYGPSLTRLERFLAEQHLLENLIEARDAAAIFLAEAAEVLTEDFDALQHAAAIVAQIVTRLEALQVAPELFEPAGLAEDRIWLEQRRGHLKQVRELEFSLLAGLAEAGGELAD